MADNVTTQSSTLATVPASTVIATDDSGGAHYQIVELADATTPTQRLAIDSSGRVTAITTRSASLRSSATSAGLTTASTAYTAGDQLGTILTFSSAVGVSAGAGLLTAATLLDEVKITGEVWLYLFDRSVTLASDNAAATFSDSDMANCLGIVKFPQGDDVTDNRFAQVSNAGLQVRANSGTSVYGALVTKSGHTFFGAVTNLKVALHVQPD